MIHDREPSDTEAARWQNFDQLLADYHTTRRRQARQRLYSTFILLGLLVGGGIYYLQRSSRPSTAPEFVLPVRPQVAVQGLPKVRTRLSPVSPVSLPPRRPQPVPASVSPSPQEATDQDFVEALPDGGYPALYDYLAAQLRYPEAARRDGVEGAVLVGFTINTEGAAKSIRVIRGLREDLDQEALRLIGQMPRWAPATINGQPVATQHTMPLTFQLTNP